MGDSAAAPSEEGALAKDAPTSEALAKAAPLRPDASVDKDVAAPKEAEALAKAAAPLRPDASDKVAVGDRVSLACDLESMDEDQARLPAGMCGEILEIDDGDLFIKFDSESCGEHWLSADDAQHVVKRRRSKRSSVDAAGAHAAVEKETPSVQGSSTPKSQEAASGAGVLAKAATTPSRLDASRNEIAAGGSNATPTKEEPIAKDTAPKSEALAKATPSPSPPDATGANVAVGDRISIVQDLESMDEKPIRLPAGMRGEILEIDDGDFLIKFDSESCGDQWVSADDAQHVVKQRRSKRASDDAAKALAAVEKSPSAQGNSAPKSQDAASRSDGSANSAPTPPRLDASNDGSAERESSVAPPEGGSTAKDAAPRLEALTNATPPPSRPDAPGNRIAEGDLVSLARDLESMDDENTRLPAGMRGEVVEIEDGDFLINFDIASFGEHWVSADDAQHVVKQSLGTSLGDGATVHVGAEKDGPSAQGSTAPKPQEKEAMGAKEAGPKSGDGQAPSKEAAVPPSGGSADAQATAKKEVAAKKEAPPEQNTASASSEIPDSTHQPSDSLAGFGVGDRILLQRQLTSIDEDEARLPSGSSGKVLEDDDGDLRIQFDDVHLGEHWVSGEDVKHLVKDTNAGPPGVADGRPSDAASEGQASDSTEHSGQHGVAHELSVASSSTSSQRVAKKEKQGKYAAACTQLKTRGSRLNNIRDSEIDRADAKLAQEELQGRGQAPGNDVMAPPSAAKLLAVDEMARTAPAATGNIPPGANDDHKVAVNTGGATAQNAAALTPPSPSPPPGQDRAPAAPKAKLGEAAAGPVTLREASPSTRAEVPRKGPKGTQNQPEKPTSGQPSAGELPQAKAPIRAQRSNESVFSGLLPPRLGPATQKKDPAGARKLSGVVE